MQQQQQPASKLADLSVIRINYNRVCCRQTRSIQLQNEFSYSVISQQSMYCWVTYWSTQMMWKAVVIYVVLLHVVDMTVVCVINGGSRHCCTPHAPVCSLEFINCFLCICLFSHLCHTAQPIPLSHGIRFQQFFCPSSQDFCICH